MSCTSPEPIANAKNSFNSRIRQPPRVRPGADCGDLLQRLPAEENAPSLASLPADFREAFFGGLDYAIVG